MATDRTAAPSDSPARQPLSLRELFCLMTMAAVCLALFLYSKWSEHERWLLGLTLGGTLLGITIARTFRERAWLSGILAGILGGSVAVWIIDQDWLADLRERATDAIWTTDDWLELRNDYFAAAATTLVLGILLAILGTACFQFLVWATDSSQSGLPRSARRHPYWSCVVAIIGVGLVGVVMNIDFLRAPPAWSPQRFIPQPPLDRPIFINHGVAPVRTGFLSRRGDWLIIVSYTAGYVGPPVGKTHLYRLDPQPQLVTLSGALPQRAACLTFDSEQDRLAYLEWNGEPFYDRPLASQWIHIVDLATLHDTKLDHAPRNEFFEGLRWQAGGKLILDYETRGYTTLVERNGQWSGEDSSEILQFKPKVGKTLEFDDDGMRIIDVESSQEIASYSKQWVDEMMEHIGGSPSQSLMLSPNARFILAGSKIFDREAQTLRDWREDDGWSGSHFYGFAGNTAVSYDYGASFRSWAPVSFLYHVPLADKLVNWLQRQPIRLIDAATGLELARTRPLASSPDSIAFSDDRTRMAVFNDEGVHIYDVPPRFR